MILKVFTGALIGVICGYFFGSNIVYIIHNGLITYMKSMLTCESSNIQEILRFAAASAIIGAVTSTTAHGLTRQTYESNTAGKTGWFMSRLKAAVAVSYP